ncbi:CAP domain-containing protein [Ferrovibrio sp.]|uniref:CAP domain-containing protein n=1 Tax=Ferrovibrio sp. TaxID=1917215 RepID=UPI0035AE4C13
MHVRFALVLLLLLALQGGNAAAQGVADWQASLLQAVNAARADARLPPLAWNPRLATAAAQHAADLQRCGKLAHEGCDGSDLPRRLARAPYQYRAAAENLALCACDAASVVQLWLGSEGHRRNLLNPNVTELGADTRIDTGDPRRALWVLVLGRSD